MTAALSLMASASLLGGCFGGSEPSTSEILQAIKNNRSVSYAYVVMASSEPRTAGRIVDEVMQTASVQKLGCVPAQGLPGLACEFTLKFEMPNGQKHDTRRQVRRFVKSDKGWQVD
jgi:hypothetical protein